MLFEQRMYAHVKFLELMAELYENEFEDFFHRLMCLRYPDFLDVRTAGSLGDRSADGLSLHSRKLYACYAPQTVKPYKIRKKFDGDLSGALAKRNGEFDTFVFVHNDRRGVHPEVTSLLASARDSMPSLRFEQMGTRRLWRECMQLDQMETEDVLRCEIPIKDTTFGIGMEDLAPLLKQLQDIRAESNPLMSLPDVPVEKLDFNRIEGADREDLLRGMRQSYLVDAFYAGSRNELEHDEVAEGFRLYYQQVRRDYSDADDVLWQLKMYFLGNAQPRPKVLRAALVVLAHFFERCDIFETPPAGWQPGIGLTA
ncbi:ABC-three component system protein [Streptomyces sp. NPDC002602]|uniref:ABC-three component system protein n=1 Tax=Streptomyces sp. NPDC002602 TaxID=3364654 RepID=UPI0036AE2624